MIYFVQDARGEWVKVSRANYRVAQAAGHPTKTRNGRTHQQDHRSVARDIKRKRTKG